MVLTYGFILGAETMGFEGLQPGDEATLVSYRESQNTDLVNDGFSSSPAPTGPFLKKSSQCSGEPESPGTLADTGSVK